MNNRSEDKLQTECVAYFKYQYGNHLIMSFPAGYVFSGSDEKRAVTGSRMKAMGYLVGTPDLLIPVARNGYHGLFIELKSGKNRLTQSQIIVIGCLTQEGYQCEVCRSIEEFMRVTVKYFNN